LPVRSAGGTILKTAITDDIEKPPERRIKRAQGFVEEVFEIIRADIMSLKIPPDTRIPIGNLVKELGVSQTPIREALSMLEALGLVTRKQFVGYCTAPKLNRKQFEELYEIRLLLEPYAAKCAAERMDEEEIKAISELAARMEPGENESRASYGKFADDDSEFHAKLAHGSKNRLIEESLSRLHTHLHIFRLRFHSEVTTEAFSEHARLVDALRRRSPGEAEAAMRNHIEKSYARLFPFAE
jgi:DNA-binding GntR family transcriptional regulator